MSEPASGHEEPRWRLSAGAAALPDFALAALFLVVWVAPAIAGKERLQALGNLLVLEFVSVHLSGFLGLFFFSSMPRGRKTLVLIAAGVFYSVILGWISIAIHSIWPLVGLWLLIGNRIAQVVFGRIPEGRERRALAMTWAWGALSFVVLAMVTIWIPVPRLGIAPEFCALPGGRAGLWQLEPHRMLLFGTLYFLGVGFAELRIPRWAAAPTRVSGRKYR